MGWILALTDLTNWRICDIMVNVKGETATTFEGEMDKLAIYLLIIVILIFVLVVLFLFYVIPQACHEKRSVGIFFKNGYITFTRFAFWLETYYFGLNFWNPITYRRPYFMGVLRIDNWRLGVGFGKYYLPYFRLGKLPLGWRNFT